LGPFYSYSSFPPKLGVVIDSIDSFDIGRGLHLHLQCLEVASGVASNLSKGYEGVG
jgi:hypothetical protein